MSLRCLHLAVLAPCLLLLLTVFAGCGPGDAGTGDVIVGVTSDLRAGVDIDRMRVILRANSEVIGQRDLSERSGGLQFPAEFSFAALKDGTEVEISLEVFQPGDDARPLLSRIARTTVVGDKTLLLRLRLESECVVRPGADVCRADQTCVAGACVDPFVDPRRLEPYSPAWKEREPDICKPVDAGDPVVIVGEGQGDFFRLDDLEEVQVEAGPQGGHHVWVAIRVKNLKQSGSITTVTGSVPEIGHAVSPYRVIFTFDQDEGGFCKLAGLRFQLDGAIRIEELLGKVVDIEVTVTDPERDVGVGRRRVTLSQTIL